MEKLICPNGHSETFRRGIGTTTLMAWTDHVDAYGKLVSNNDPNITTQEYTCDICGASFKKSWRYGKELGERS